MEAAKPVFFSTPQFPNQCEEKFNKVIDEKDKKMTDITSFEIKLTNEIVKLELAKSENNQNIIIKIYNKNIKFKYHILFLNINEFHSLNTFFTLYQGIDELYKLLLETINKNKYSISIKNNIVLLVLEFTMPGEKVIDINFELKEEKLKKEDLMNQIYEIITELTEENKVIKDEIKNLKIENNNLKMELNKKNLEYININNQIYNINNEIRNIKSENFEIKDKLKLMEESLNKKRVKKVKKEEENSYNSYDKNKNIINIDKNEEEGNMNLSKIMINPENAFRDSKIVNKNEDKNNLIKWLSSVGKISSIKLIYRATDNGDDSDSFFEKCRNMGPTISLIKSGNGRIFGGFSKAEWTDKNGKIKIKDDKAFLFSLDNKESYKILKPEVAISCYPGEYALVYGNKDDRYGIRLFTNFLEKTNYENLASKVYDAPSDYCLSGHNKFQVEDAEVFQVLFE